MSRPEELLAQVAALTAENERLRAEVEKLEEVSKRAMRGEATFINTATALRLDLARVTEERDGLQETVDGLTGRIRGIAEQCGQDARERDRLRTKLAALRAAGQALLATMGSAPDNPDHCEGCAAETALRAALAASKNEQ